MKVELPFLAEGIEGGDVVQVLVKEGDQVTEGQSLIELETEKATIPVPAPAAGTVARLLVRPGDHLKVGQALVELEGGAPPVKAAAQATSVAPREAPQAAPAPAPASPTPESPKQREERSSTEATQADYEADRPTLPGAAIAAPPPSAGWHASWAWSSHRCKGRKPVGGSRPRM